MNEYQLTNSGSQVQSAVTASLATFPSQITALQANKVDKISGKGLSTNDYTTADKTLVSMLVTNGDGNSFLANNGTYKTISSTITYPQLANLPVLNTSSSNAQTTNASETITGTISLHKVSKTGSYTDLLNKPTLPNSFANITSGSTTISASSGTDTLTLTAGSNISIGENASTKTITVSAVNVGTTNYNELSNKPILNVIGTSSSPVVLQTLSNGIYNLSGYYKVLASDTSSILLNGNAKVNLYGDGSTNITALVETSLNISINTMTYSNSSWSNVISYFPTSSDISSIQMVTEYPTTMLSNVLYMKVDV